MAEEIPPSEEIANKTSEEISETIQTSDKLASATQALQADPTNIEAQQAVAEAQQQSAEAQQAFSNALVEAIGAQGADVNEALTSGVESTDPNTAKVQTAITNVTIDVNKLVTDMQTKNGEAGKSLSDSPSTMRELLTKFPWKTVLIIAAIAGAVGIGFGVMDKIAANLTGCYMNSISQKTSVKLMCSSVTQSTCNCTQVPSLCGQPACGSVTTQPIDPFYSWQVFTAWDVLANALSAAGSAAKNVFNWVGDFIQNLPKYFIYFVIGAVTLLILYVIMKMVISWGKKKNAQNYSSYRGSPQSSKSGAYQFHRGRFLLE
jgi:hypothetical protein